MQLIEFIFRNPLELIVAAITLSYILRGKGWHGIYAMYLLLGINFVVQEVGLSQMMASVIIGVCANELLRLIRRQLKRENNPNKDYT